MLDRAHAHDVEHAIEPAGAQGREVEVEPREILGLVELELEFLVELTMERVERPLTWINRSSEATPVVRIPDTRFVIALLEEI
jgi:hypothetical protein